MVFFRMIIDYIRADIFLQKSVFLGENSLQVEFLLIKAGRSGNNGVFLPNIIRPLLLCSGFMPTSSTSPRTLGSNGSILRSQLYFDRLEP